MKGISSIAMARICIAMSPSTARADVLYTGQTKRRIMRLLGRIGFAGLLLVTSLHARANLILNGGFENPVLTAGTPAGFVPARVPYCYEASSDCNGGTFTNPTSVGNWNWSSLAVLVQVSNGAPSMPWIDPSQIGFGGNQVAALQSVTGLQPGNISQQFTATSSGAYQVTWVAAGRDYFSLGPSGGHGNETYTVSLEDDSTHSIVASNTYTTSTDSNFIGQSFDASLSGGVSYTLAFAGMPGPSDDQTALLDNVDVSLVAASVPEPSSWLLIAVGLAGLGFRRIRIFS